MFNFIAEKNKQKLIAQTKGRNTTFSTWERRGGINTTKNAAVLKTVVLISIYDNKVWMYKQIYRYRDNCVSICIRVREYIKDPISLLLNN